jgi:tetratricopeptide (TPR) repeat protein
MDNMLLTFIERIQKEFPNLKPNQEDSDGWLNEANALLHANQLAEAEQKFKACLVAEPDFHGGFEGLAEIYRQQGRVAEARYFAQQALMRARRFINDGSMDQVVFDEIYAAYKSTDTQAYAGMTTAALVQAMAQSMAHPDSALLQAILKRGAEAVPPLRTALREDEEVTWVSDFAAQLLANLKLNGVDEADEAIPELVNIFRRIDEDFLDSVSSYLSTFGAKAVHPLIAVAEETELGWAQRGSAITAAIAAAEGSDELREEIATALRQQLARYVERKEADIENPNVATVICDLLDLRDKASLPLMRQAFALDLVDDSIVDEYSLAEIDLPYKPRRWPFDAAWLQKHELSLLNAVHSPEDDSVSDLASWSPSFDDDNAGTLSRADAVREIRELMGLRKPAPEQPPYIAEKKPGRNAPCWCGSGKKYKHCHLHEDEAKTP